MNTSLRDNIDWVGYVDWSVRDFHGYVTNRGATYNAYLMRDEKTALIDTVKGPYADYLVDHVKALTPLESIDYIVCNHSEPDHSSSLPRMVQACPGAQVICNEKCVEILGYHFDTAGWSFHVVDSGDTLSLGKRSLTFINTPMVHWPESMATYVAEEKLLFSMDAFGQHFASTQRFDDEVDLEIVMYEAKKYYANIVMLYGKQIAKVLDALGDVPLEMVAPSHGVIWRSHFDRILAAYRDWVVCKPAAKVVVVYDSMWGSTKRMGEAIVEGAARDGVEVKLLHARTNGITEIATEVLDAAVIAFGSSTLNMGMMPEMGAVMTYLKGLKPQSKAGFAFGSYGWGKGGPEALHDWLPDMKIDVLRDPLKSRFVPTAAVLDECRAAGAMLADKAVALASA